MLANLFCPTKMTANFSVYNIKMYSVYIGKCNINIKNFLTIKKDVRGHVTKSIIRHAVQSSDFIGACLCAFKRGLVLFHFHSSVLEPYLDVFFRET